MPNVLATAAESISVTCILSTAVNAGIDAPVGKVTVSGLALNVTVPHLSNIPEGKNVQPAVVCADSVNS